MDSTVHKKKKQIFVIFCKWLSSKNHKISHAESHMYILFISGSVKRRRILHSAVRLTTLFLPLRLNRCAFAAGEKGGLSGGEEGEAHSGATQSGPGQHQGTVYSASLFRICFHFTQSQIQIRNFSNYKSFHARSDPDPNPDSDQGRLQHRKLKVNTERKIFGY